MSFTSFLSDRGSPAPQGPAPSSTSFLQTAQFSQPSASPSSPQSSSSSSEPTAESLFSSPKFDPASLHPLAGLGNDQQLDYLLLEDDKTNMEGGSLMGNKSYLDDMQTGAGTAYVTGLLSGGALGAWNGLRKPGVSGAGLRWNAILNASSMRGTYFANTAGVLAVYYNTFNWAVPKFTGDGQNVYSSIISGALSGALFQSTSGLRSTVTGAGVMAVGAAGWNLFKERFM